MALLDMNRWRIFSPLYPLVLLQNIDSRYSKEFSKWFNTLIEKDSVESNKKENFSDLHDNTKLDLLNRQLNSTHVVCFYEQSSQSIEHKSDFLDPPKSLEETSDYHHHSKIAKFRLISTENYSTYIGRWS